MKATIFWKDCTGVDTVNMNILASGQLKINRMASGVSVYEREFEEIQIDRIADEFGQNIWKSVDSINN